MAINGVTDYTNTYAASGATSSRNLSGAAQDYLNELKEKYPDVNITVADFKNEKQFDSYMLGSSGFNNIAVASNIIEKMANDPATAAKYEKVIADVPESGKKIKSDCDAMGIKLISCGARIDKNGKVTYWGVAEGKTMENPGTVYKEKMQKQLEQKRAEKKEKEALEKRHAEVAETEEKLLEKMKESAKKELQDEGIGKTTRNEEGKGTQVDFII